MRRIYLSIITFVLSAIFVAAPKYSQAEKGQPNVLFIIVDTLRSDHLGCYGYDKIKTPNIDSLAKRGILFENVISQAPLTFPSHVSMFTSTYPQYSKARDNGNFRLDASAITLAEILGGNGYTAAAFVSAFVLDSKFGLDQGFQTYNDKLQKITQKRIIKLMEEERTADKVSAAAVNWLRENKDKKFFLWVHYYDPHTIYNPPSPYKEIYKDNLYDGEIAFADEQIGVILNTLKELNLAQNTLIIFASDHGEGLGEHGESSHAVFVYDTTLKVPLIFCYPAELPQAKAIGQQVRLIDIMPTILDFLEVKKNKEIQGASLLSLIKGAQRQITLAAYSESFYAKYHFNWSPLQSFRTEEWKYIKSSEPELYSVRDDPHELINLAGNRPDVVKDMEKKLSVFLEKTSSSKKESKTDLDDETKEKLMSLGYISGSVTPETKEPVPIKMIQIMQKINLSDRLANEGMIEEAIQGYNEILRLDPDNAEAYIHLAQCYKETGKYDEAIRYFKKAASFKPDEAEVHDGLGNIYKDMGRVNEAFKEFEIALALDRDNPVIINNIGWCYQQKLEIDRAMEEYDRALKLDSGLATAHANMAICYRIKGQLDKAAEEANTAVTLEPELAFAHAELCATVATKGDLEKAIPYCQKAIELDPGGIDGYNNLGVCLERKGEFDKALENYRKVQELAPWNALIYCNIGNVYIQKKEFPKAEESFRKALEIDPNLKKAAQMLELLSQRGQN